MTQGIGEWNATELYGGSVNEVVVSPGSPETVYAVSAGVGLFGGQDGGESCDFLVAGGDYPIRSLAIDPVSPTVLYMFAAWDLQRSKDGGDIWGLLASGEGGESWEPVTGILGQVPTYSLTEAVATARTIVYAGTTGGYVAASRSQAPDLAGRRSAMVKAGGHRYTTRLVWRVHQPIVLKVYGP